MLIFLRRRRQAHSLRQDLHDGPAAYREDNLEPQLPSYDKVHIRGLDDVNHDEIKAYAREHYPSQEISRIEWIDDTSANLIYPTEETAAEALESLTQASRLDLSPQQLRRAKPFASKAFISFQVRQANTHDVKQPGAHETSRFYLFNPEYDPREQRNKPDNRRNRGRDGRGIKRRRSEPDPMQFDESMYDDPPAAQQGLDQPFGSERRPKRSRKFEGSRDDLFADPPLRGGGRLRDRSASPSRLANGDGRFGFDDEDAGYDTPAAPRQFPRHPNAGKELLSSPAATVRSFLRESSAPRELFPNRHSPARESNLGKELFSNGVGTPHHRRTDAFDAADELEGSPTMHAKSRSLEDRITGGPPLRHRSPENRRSGPSMSLNPGFSIKGVAKEANARVKELFPDKVGDNSGKELFAGRRHQRQRAEDLFG